MGYTCGNVWHAFEPHVKMSFFNVKSSCDFYFCKDYIFACKAKAVLYATNPTVQHRRPSTNQGVTHLGLMSKGDLQALAELLGGADEAVT